MSRNRIRRQLRRAAVSLLSLGILFATFGGTAQAASTAGAVDPKSVWTVTDGITLRLQQDRYPTAVREMTIVLENRTDSVMLYGQGWTFEKYQNGAWKKLEVREDSVFTSEGYTLYEHDRRTLTVPTGFLKKPLSAGRYRLTGCTLRVAPDDQNLAYGGDFIEYPAYRLEFTVAVGAKAEPAVAAPDEQPEVFPAWELPELEEDWLWYTPWDIVDLYGRSGMDVWQFVPGSDGLIAILYRPHTPENEYLHPGDKLLLDVVERKTGRRHPVLQVARVEQDRVAAHRDGFRIDSEGEQLFYHFDPYGAPHLELFRE